MTNYSWIFFWKCKTQLYTTYFFKF